MSKLWYSYSYLPGSPFCFFTASGTLFGPGRAEVRINPRVISDTEETAVFVGTLTIPRLRHIDGAEERSCTFDAKPQGVSAEMVRPMFSQTQSWRPGLDWLTGPRGDTAGNLRIDGSNLRPASSSQLHFKLRWDPKDIKKFPIKYSDILLNDLFI